MWQAERYEDPEEVHRTAGERLQNRIWTALPAKVLEDSDGHVVSVQPTIMGKQIDIKTGQKSDVAMPRLDMVPVQFAGGGGFTATFPIKEMDEGLLVFASRCIDGWWLLGGVQPQLEERWHNLSDAFFIPGIRSTPRKLSPPASTTSAQLRSDDGETYFEVAPEGVINLVAPNAGRVNVQATAVFMADLPTADPGVVGRLWNDLGTVKISGG